LATLTARSVFVGRTGGGTVVLGIQTSLFEKLLLIVGFRLRCHWTPFQVAAIHGQLVALVVNQSLVAEVGGVTRRPTHYTVVADLRVALGTFDFKGWIAGP
jgi:hypothetical protein